MCAAIFRARVLPAFLFPVLIAGLSCSTMPLTGRKQLNLVPDLEMLSMSFRQYGDFVKQNSVSKDRSGQERVRTVGTRIKGAVEEYVAANGLGERLKGYAWEFNLVESNEANAWCMPGGKVVVYTGILPLTRDEQGLAVVLGHEIAHAIAEHGNERMSQEMIAQFGGSALSEILKNKPAETQQLWMAATNKGKAPPEFMSTHPADETRIAQIRENLPEALKYYRPVR